MKKVLKSFILVVLCLCTCLTFAGCGKVKWSEVTTNTEGVLSNGGIVLTSTNDGWLYFINRLKTNSEVNNEKSNVQAGIYRVKTDDKGQIIYKENTAKASDKDKEETKEFSQVERVVDHIVGYEEGSVYVFGNYIYYATPCKDVNDEGEMLINKTEIRRYDIKNKASQKLYTTKQSEDTITYGYYVQNNALYLVIYEKNVESLTSVKLGKSAKTVFVKNGVKSAILSEVANSNKFAEKSVFYTITDPDNGTIVKRILPDGTGETQLSKDKEVELLHVKGDFLIYSLNDNIYHKKVDAYTEELPTEEANVICHENYEHIVFDVEKEGQTYVNALVYKDTTIIYLGWENGECVTYDIIKRFNEGEKVEFIGVEGDWVVYKHQSTICKSQFKNVTDSDNKKPVELSSTKFDEAKELMAPEVMNGYVYGFVTDSSTSTTYLYRISLETPENPAELPKAEFIGVKE